MRGSYRECFWTGARAKRKDPALFAKRRAYEASRSGEEKAAFDRMLENTMVSSRQPISPDRASTCTALTHVGFTFRIRTPLVRDLLTRWRETLGSP